MEPGVYLPTCMICGHVFAANERYDIVQWRDRREQLEVCADLQRCEATYDARLTSFLDEYPWQTLHAIPEIAYGVSMQRQLEDAGALSASIGVANGRDASV